MITMKKLFFFTILSFCFVNLSFGQGMNISASSDKSRFVYVGSLLKDKAASANKEKIKVEVFGGDFYSTYLGTTTYRIATRNSYQINRETHGGPDGTDFRYALRIYDNGTNFDVVVETISWADLVVRSWILDSEPVAHEVKCRTYDPAGKAEVTNLFTHTVFISSSANGNIGIGVSKPTERLEVNGTIRSKEVKIEATNWPDFVFDKAYKLPSLKEVENHIREYNHLPDIPSEKQVTDEGIKVSEMQAKLLQKIEELTLYIIEQEKRINQLEKKLNE